jgi:hypothetical protein
MLEIFLKINIPWGKKKKEKLECETKVRTELKIRIRRIHDIVDL